MTTRSGLASLLRRAGARQATAATALLLVIALGAPSAQQALAGRDRLAVCEALPLVEGSARPAPVAHVPVAAIAPRPERRAAVLRRAGSAHGHGLPLPRAPDRR